MATDSKVTECVKEVPHLNNTPGLRNCLLPKWVIVPGGTQSQPHLLSPPGTILSVCVHGQLLWQLIKSYTYTVHKLLDKYRHTVKSKGDLGKGRNVSSTSQHGVLVLLPRPILQSFFLSSRDFAAGMSASFSSFLGSVATARRMASHIPPINTAQNKFSNGAKGSWIPSRRAESLKYTKKMTTPK